MGAEGLLPSPSCPNGGPLPAAGRTGTGACSNAPTAGNNAPISYHVGAVLNRHPIGWWVTGMQGPTSAGAPAAIHLGDRRKGNLGAPDGLSYSPSKCTRVRGMCGCQNQFAIRDMSLGGTGGGGATKKRLKQEVEWTDNRSTVRGVWTDCHKHEGVLP